LLFLKADTAVEVLVGPVVAVGDGFTPVTTMTIAGADEAELIKYNGATALVVTAITGTVAAITSADGYYTLDLSTGDTDTEGFLTLLINDDSLMLPVRLEFMVVNATVYDSLFAALGTDTLDVQVTGMGANVLTAAAINANAFAATKFATDAINKIARAIGIQTNTALDDIHFLFVAASDHVTPVTGATGITVERAIDSAGSFSAAGGTVTEIGDGVYQYDAVAADLNGSIITLKFSATGGTPGAPDDRIITIFTVV